MQDSDRPSRSSSIAILDYGSQYSQLIARRVRECHVYCELLPWDTPAETLDALNPRGIILSGGPNSVYEPGAPTLTPQVLARQVPMLGICYGMQLLNQHYGGVVAPSSSREYGPSSIALVADSPLFSGIGPVLDVWMSHGDRLESLPEGFAVLAHSPNSPIAAMADERRRLYGIQFHPEVAHTPRGLELLRNFCYLCGCEADWTPGSFIAEAEAAIRARVGDGRVLCAISGGVDSSVVAVLLGRVLGDRLTSVFVNNGLLRKGEVEESLARFRAHLGGNLVYVDATERFLDALAGVRDPERKRMIIGREFVRVFEAEARKVGKVDFLAQGTLYPDVIESATPATKSAARIKTHHNVGGLPEHMQLALIEPLRYLFKDEVRQVGLALGLPPEMVFRAPFPGPGLAVRVIGSVNPDRLAVLREADAILRDEIANAGLDRAIWQYFVVLTPVRTVGVMGDGRTYANVAAVRAVTSNDAMTADWARIPYDVLARISNRIVNEVAGINRVVYDISSKPPATIEWE
ncbi:MAG: glutamine-hydrolyzing GMP synthase [Chloroflexi bacterium]|nr:glutamine-hydrolyzing GMP synthase [Chloroflexota bacterium]